jgi:hypothetical protein
MIRLDRSYTELEISIISEIQSKKSYLSMLDEIDTYSNTKSDIDRSDQEIIIYNEWYIILLIIINIIHNVCYVVYFKKLGIVKMGIVAYSVFFNHKIEDYLLDI